jgi:hypothetical protein
MSETMFEDNHYSFEGVFDEGSLDLFNGSSTNYSIGTDFEQSDSMSFLHVNLPTAHRTFQSSC